MKRQVELTFPENLKGEPVFYYIIRDFKIVPNILEASFSTQMGWAIVTLEGDPAEMERLFAYLRKKNVEIKKR